MSAGRLSKTQKKQLVESYRSGQTTSEIAKEFGCSPNTVNRTVKTFLSPEEYEALKASRGKGGAAGLPQEKVSEPMKVRNSSELTDRTVENNVEGLDQGVDLDEETSRSLALDDADDFREGSEEDDLEDSQATEVFHEVVPLNTAHDLSDQEEVPCPCEPLLPGLLPGSVYMLVDKSVELDARPLREFPELGLLEEDDKERKALILFSNPRSARRQCGRSQRVIKIPDSSVFEISAPYLLSRGITRLFLEGALIALDL